MGEFMHLVVVKFKEEVVVDDILKGLEELVSQLDTVKSFLWGIDIESEEMVRQGFTHAFVMTFKSKEDFISFTTHPKHLDFSSTFSSVIQNVVLLDFPSALVKPTPPPVATATVPDLPPDADADAKDADAKVGDVVAAVAASTI